MSTSRLPSQTGETRAAPMPPPSARAPRAALAMIGCDGCGRRFATDDGPGMIAMIKGPCPDCGGHFRLVDD